MRRLAVEGDSMDPTLRAGDRVVAIRLPIRAGDVVAVRDPRSPARILVKRAASVGAGGAIDVRGDNPSSSTDSRHFGPVPRHLVVGRVVYRYAPPASAGRVGALRRPRAGDEVE